METIDEHLDFAHYIATLLDNQVKILGVRVGLDPLLGLFPVIGDFITMIFSFYIVWIAVKMKLPKYKIAKMLKNIALDFVCGLVPVIGDFSDFVINSNERNLAILRKHHFKKTVEGNVISGL